MYLCTDVVLVTALSSLCDVYESKTEARHSDAIHLCAPESATAFSSLQAQRDLTSYPDWSGGAFDISA
jgi:hypothetical protein